MSESGRDTAFIREVYLIVLGRLPSALELVDEDQGRLHHNQFTLLRGLLDTDEFRRLRQAWKEGRESHSDPGGLEASLQQLGPPDTFVKRAYESILGRSPDPSGAAHYTAALTAGESRTSIVRALALSDEFERKERAVPRDVQLCELANPAKWDNEEWLDILRSLGLSDDKLLMHRKPYEFTQLIYGCRRLGMIRENKSFLSVGAGHEQILYWLANRVRRVVATDLYEGSWQGERAREGDPTVLENPERFAPFPYRRDRLAFMKMDGRRLEFPDEEFDVSYSLSSIEHFGGLEGAGQTVREMARVLKAGGVLALATEYVLAGPRHDETFLPDEIEELIQLSGLNLVEPLDDRVYRRFETRPVRLEIDPYESPHMTVQLGDTVFTSVMLFLRKS